MRSPERFVDKKRFWKKKMLLAALIYFSAASYSQNACPIGSATITLKCPTENEYETMGIPTVIGSTFTWYKNGARVAGPLPGDGQPTSFGFAVRTSSDAGQYTVEETLPNNSKVCRFNQLVQVTALPVAQTLTGAGPVCPSSIRTLTITATQPNVTYGLYKDGGLWESQHSTGTGPLSFDVIPGLYIVQADKDSCPGVYRFFGSAVVTALPPLPTINSTTINSASISWSGSGNFIVEYGPRGFSPGIGATAGGGQIINASSSPVAIGSLSSGAYYDVYVRQACQAGTYVSSEVARFTTDCAAISVFPWVEGFEGVGAPNIPSCWNELDENGTLDWFTSTFQPRAGTKVLYGEADDYMVLPRMTLSGTKRLKFWVKSDNPLFTPYPCIVRLSTTNNAKSSFTTILLNDTLRSQTAYEEKIIDLSAYSGNIYLAVNNHLVLKFDDFTIENKPPCPGAALVKVVNADNDSITIKWTGTGTFIAEYGLAGFTPGTGATNGVGGVVIANATSPLAIPGLLAGTNYDIYIRQNCTAGGNGFSTNSPKLTVTTFASCATATAITSNCVTVTANMPGGNGFADFWGLYPVNSTGKQTPGKELLYKFTPSSTGVYYIDATSVSAELCYFYKPVSAGCGNGGWTGIANISQQLKYPIGLLQSGTEYYLLIDNPTTFATTHVFKICKANVVAPSFTNTCITTNTTEWILANSPKLEYLIDDFGNLVAALDFSAVTTEAGPVTGSYYVNGNAVRHDTAQKEYLDRNFNITTSAPPSNTIGVTLYFTNNELTRLINEPNDGIADVASVTDLKVTREEGFCGGSSGTNTTLLTPTGSGNYDASSKFIQFNTSGLSSFYLHGGNEALFNSTIICPGDGTTMAITPPGTNYIYQWQVDMGSGFVNIIPSDYYTGINTSTLSLRSPPTSFYGYKYRCIAIGASSITSDSKTLKFAMRWTGVETNVWEDPRNWSCDEFGKNAIPDANVDVIIPNVPKKPVINSNVSCRSVTIQSTATLTVTPGFKLTITGH